MLFWYLEGPTKNIHSSLFATVTVGGMEFLARSFCSRSSWVSLLVTRTNIISFSHVFTCRLRGMNKCTNAHTHARTHTTNELNTFSPYFRRQIQGVQHLPDMYALKSGYHNYSLYQNSVVQQYLHMPGQSQSLGIVTELLPYNRFHHHSMSATPTKWQNVCQLYCLFFVSCH